MITPDAYNRVNLVHLLVVGDLALDGLEAAVSPPQSPHRLDVGVLFTFCCLFYYITIARIAVDVS